MASRMLFPARLPLVFRVTYEGREDGEDRN